MKDSAELITDSVDSALSQIDFIDKTAFYKILERNGISPKEIGVKFERFHEIIKQEFGIRHFKIERYIVQNLHNQSIQKKNDRQSG